MTDHDCEPWSPGRRTLAQKRPKRESSPGLISGHSRGLGIALSLLLLGCATEEPVTPELPDGPWLDDVAPSAVLGTELCQTPQPGATPLRRLTNAEYANTLVDLDVAPADASAATAAFPREPTSLGFRNGATTLVVDSLMAQKYHEVAVQLSPLYRPKCATQSSEQDCVKAFITGLGLLMHRRPLSANQTEDYLSLYQKARAGGDDFDAAARWVVEAMLQSPYFLYRVEIPETQVARVTGYEMAARLSYTFWQAPPDEELYAAAAAGELSSDEQVLAQVRRLLKDQRALRVYEFFEQWLDLDQLQAVERDPELYPDLPPHLAELLRAESRAFISSLLTSGDSSLSDLLGADFTYVNSALAHHYGLEDPGSDTFEKVSAPGRSGILTQGMLAVKDGAGRSSIVRRGLKLRTDFLCQLVPKPPDDVDITLEGLGAELSQAERLEMHRSQAACLGCHSLMDPLGVAFEGFDAVGRPRSVDEYGSPVVTEGEITGSMDSDGPVSSVADVAAALSQSREMEQCYLMQNFRFFFGREADGADLCSQAQLTQSFQDGEQSLAGLFVGLAQTDAFLYKAALSVGEPNAAEQGGEP